MPETVELICREVWGGNQRIQASMTLPGMSGAVYSLPHGGGKGGDICYLSACMSGLLARICVVDVAGHGEEVSQLSAWLKQAMARHLNKHMTDVMFEEINELVHQRGIEALSSAVCVTYDAIRGNLEYCYAGHPKAMRYRRADSRWGPLAVDSPHESGARNVVFGAERYVRYDVGKVTLDEGDRILLYTDGVTETPNGQRALFGEERLLAVLNAHVGETPSGLAEIILGKLHEHAGSDSFDHDDVSILIFETGPRYTRSMVHYFFKNNFRKIFHKPAAAG